MTKDILSRLQEQRPFVGNAMHIPRNLVEKARMLCWQFNHCDPTDARKQHDLLQRLFGTYHASVYLMPDFHCDFGFNIHFKGFALVNYNCVMLDTSPITIGRSVLLGPGVVLACPGHPLDPQQRGSGAYETSAPITIEDNVWIGANCTVCGGVTIGEGSVIGASSVVNQSVPPGVVAAGVPCKVARPLTDSDRLDLSQLDF